MSFHSREEIEAAFCMKEVQLMIEGMSCVSCAQGVEKALKAVEGVQGVTVNFATSRALVHLKEEVKSESLLEAVHAAGYRAVLASAEDDMRDPAQYESGFWRFAFAALFTFPLFMQMFWEDLGLSWELPGVIQGLLATIVQFGLGWPFYEGTYHALRARSANMDTLIVLGTTAAYGFSVVVYFFELGHYLYFESSALIITLVLLGRWLESRSKGKASEAIRKLIRLQPKKAQVEVDGVFVDVDVNQMKVGDIFMVRPGESVPVDGRVIEGFSTVNESMLTGESFPVHKQEGEQIFAATLNQNGLIRAEATGVGSDTVLSGIIRLVQQAQNTKAPIQRLADQISSYFVPAVLAISLLTLLAWSAFGMFTDGLVNAISVLVIACPCALGLATPTVILVASGLGAERGILFKKAEALETAEKIQTLMIDKTGTLTEGRPSVVDVIESGNVDAFRVMQIAMSLEAHSLHPVSSAVIQYGEKIGLRPLNLTDFETFPGKGISAKIDGVEYGVGSLQFAGEKGFSIEDSDVFQEEKKGKTVCAVWSSQKMFGFIVVSDPIRKQSAKAIAELNRMGIQTVMITGDNRNTAEAIAKQAGISEYEAQVLPGDKADRVKERMRKGRVVGMVGDGINDAPALAAANVGFAVAAGSDVAIESADVTLMRNDLMGVVTAIRLSKETFKKIRQNLFFAFIFNILGIPLAACGLLNPVIAAAAMALSSVSVVTNALLLKRAHYG